jgi:pyruvate dehydrogenase E2 component (dihydrolipoamide acetyltransferase)
MTIEIVMPPLSQTSDTLILTAWLKQGGELVTKGEPLFEVETDKATLEVEAPASGVLQAILAQPGSEVAVKAVIGHIAASDEIAAGQPAPVAAPAVSTSGATEREPTHATPNPATASLPASRRDRIFASPRARHLAQQAGVPLRALTATGPDGTIVERDVHTYLDHAAAQPKVLATPVARRMAEAAGIELAAVTPLAPGAMIKRADVEAALKRQAEAAAPPLTVPSGQTVPLSPTRKTIACRMQHSHQTTAPITLTRDVDATELVLLRQRILADVAGQDARPTYTDFLVSIVARCLAKHPHLNAAFEYDELVVYDTVNMGLAVDTERGLLVPVLRAVETKGLLALARERTDLVRRTMAGTVTADELAGATFTLSNLGPLGVDTFTPLINTPQVAILGVGRIRPAVLPVGGAVSIRHAMFLSLTVDHRAVDGGPAARLLGELAALIENPERIWL